MKYDGQYGVGINAGSSFNATLVNNIIQKYNLSFDIDGNNKIRIKFDNKADLSITNPDKNKDMKSFAAEFAAGNGLISKVHPQSNYIAFIGNKENLGDIHNWLKGNQIPENQTISKDNVR